MRLGTENLFSESQAKRILKTIERMSERQLMNFSRRSLPDQVKDVIQCGFSSQKIESRVFNPDNNNLNPSQDSDVTSIYNLNNNRQRREASIAKLVIDGYVGSGTIEMGGYDYHNNERSETTQQDREVGEAIGRLLSLADKKNSPLLIYVFSDGSVSSGTTPDPTSPEGLYRHTSDNANHSSTFMIYMNPRGQGRPRLRLNGQSFSEHRRQIGHYKTNGSVERSANAISNNVTNMAKAVVLNYLALVGDEGKLEEVVGQDPFIGSYEDYILFDKNVS